MPALQLPNAHIATSGKTPTPSPDTPFQPPVIIPARPNDALSPPFPLNHARILYNNLLSLGNAVSSTGTNASYTLVPNTYQAWQFVLTSTAYIDIELSANQNVDTICIGAHNLKGVTVSALYSVSLAVPAIPIADSKLTTSTNAIIFHVSNPVPLRKLRIFISGSTGLNYSIGWVAAGVALQMARPFFSGHNPMSQNKQHRYFDAWTETGQMVGRSKRSVQLEGDFSWENLPDVWYRQYMPPFIESATALPFFIAWNLRDYPDDVAMAFVDEDINSPYTGVRDLRSVSFSARGIA